MGRRPQRTAPGDGGGVGAASSRRPGRRRGRFSAAGRQGRDRQDSCNAFHVMARERLEALLIISNPLFTDRREQIVTLANHRRIITVYPLREYAAVGGLLSYGASIKDAYRQSGVYAGRILSGAKPAELPVLQPTLFELVLNLRTAKAFGPEISPMLLARADEVIE